MDFLFVIDPVETLNPRKDSSLDLMLEASHRQHRVSILDFRGVRLLNGEVFCEATEVDVAPGILESDHASSGLEPTGASRSVPVADFDVVFIRKDPPFDSDYLALTYLLERAEGKAQFVNSPRGVREVSEKLFGTRYRSHMPRTMVTWDLQAAIGFAVEHEKVVLKPAFLGSGEGIFLCSGRDENFEARVNTILSMEPRGPVIVQEYLPEGREGDTRVMVLDGSPIAALGRKPAAGDFRANIAVGGKAVATDLTDEQTAIANEVGKDIQQRGIVFAGLDFIGDRLIEINVTSPTLIQELRRVSGVDMSHKILDFLGA